MYYQDSVVNILNSVTTELLEHPKRRFIYVEQYVQLPNTHNTNFC